MDSIKNTISGTECVLIHEIVDGILNDIPEIKKCTTNSYKQPQSIIILKSGVICPSCKDNDVQPRDGYKKCMNCGLYIY